VTDLRAKSQDVVVLDPPRTGMSPQAVAEVLRLQAARVVYVSCDPATLARDAKALLAGGYHLGAIEAFDLFPNTPHIETLCVFDYEG
jgi:23S rRNA (uracil1939-C5)-methyltransferase